MGHLGVLTLSLHGCSICVCVGVGEVGCLVRLGVLTLSLHGCSIRVCVQVGGVGHRKMVNWLFTLGFLVHTNTDRSFLVVLR